MSGGELLIWGLILAYPLYRVVKFFITTMQRVKNLESKVFELEKEAKGNEMMTVSNKNRIDRLDGGS